MEGSSSPGDHSIVAIPPASTGCLLEDEPSASVRRRIRRLQFMGVLAAIAPLSLLLYTDGPVTRVAITGCSCMIAAGNWIPFEQNPMQLNCKCVLSGGDLGNPYRKRRSYAKNLTLQRASEACQSRFPCLQSDMVAYRFDHLVSI